MASVVLIIPPERFRDEELFHTQEELRKEVFAPASDKEVHVTVSIGLAQYKQEEEMKSFFHRVKKLMLQAKQEGRNRIYAE